MVSEGARRPGDPTSVTLEPGERYELALDPKKLGLSPGAYRVTAVYHPYDLPEDAWRGTRETEPRPLTID
jgi:FtsP/CotA-like multicopper oxidase with cupredoxin domain